MSVVTCAGTAENVTLPLLINLNYKNNKAKLIKLSDYTLLSSDGNKCDITDGTNKVTYSINQQNVILPLSGENWVCQ